jgi:tRNA-Thr(GGU) m(6)t(6)A37 methyltransferase TsaA
MINFKPIGVIHTPYKNSAPRQPVPDAEGEFRVELLPQYVQGLDQLDSFKYIYLIFYCDRAPSSVSLTVPQPRARSHQVGLFACRSPYRPNPIGLSIVRLKKIEGNVIYTSGVDALDGTPLLDIKPYLKGLDAKEDANNGWSRDFNYK